MSGSNRRSRAGQGRMLSRLKRNVASSKRRGGEIRNVICDLSGTEAEGGSVSPIADFLKQCVQGGSSGKTSREYSAPTAVKISGNSSGKLMRSGYSCAWRVLDAQYVRVDGYPRAVPQRRRRVFVVGYLGDWRYPASVLFEPDCLPGNTPPRRKAGAGVARSVTASTGGASGKEQQLDFVGGDGQPLNAIESGRGFYSESDVAQTLEAHEDQHRRNVIFAHETGPGFWQGGNISGTLRAEGENRPSRPSNIVCMATGQGNAECHENCAVNLTCNHEAPLICAGFCQGASPTAGGIGYHEQVSPTIKAGESGTAQVPAVICVHGSQDQITNTDHANAVNRNNGLENCVCQYGEVAGTLTERHDSSPCDDRGMNIVYENHMQDSRIKACGECNPQINANAGTGGCTFVSNGPSDYPVESELGWIGFDCAHYGDAQDHEAWNEYFPDTFQKWQSLQLLHYCPGSEVRSKGYCEEQCRQIVHQLIEMQKGSTRE